ncbi:MAG TPA: acyl-CoA dehydrogenase family protein, partial [Frankiaceae bacterium]|nr:acyl-CoA dehydrogenase family protein [Frankiaceae bacterium]
MDLTYSETDEAFRAEFRSWLDANLPQEWRTHAFWSTKTEGESFDLRREWEAKKAQDGWAGIAWPKEYGGRSGTPTQKAIYDEEMNRAHAPATVNTLGLTFLA